MDWSQLRNQTEIIKMRESAKSDWRSELLFEGEEHPYVDVMPDGKEKPVKKKKEEEEPKEEKEEVKEEAITEGRARTREEARAKLAAHKKAMEGGGKSPYFKYKETQKKLPTKSDPWSTHPSDAKAFAKEDVEVEEAYYGGEEQRKKDEKKAAYEKQLKKVLPNRAFDQMGNEIDPRSGKKLEEARDGKSAKDKGYTLRDWFKGGGWKQTGGKYDGKPCAKQPGQTTKPFCRDADDRAAMDKDERDRRAAKKRREDPNPDRSGKAKNVTEEHLEEKKDACYHKVKSRYKIWPSAYASGALVKCRKKGAKNWGNSDKK